MLAWQVGCAPTASAPPVAAGDGHAHDGHDHGPDGALPKAPLDEHGHDHSHAEAGPNGGHLLVLGDEKFHVEWLHDDEAGKLTVFILDGTAKKLVPIAAEKLVIEKKIGDKTDKYELVAVDRQGDMPKTAKFEIVDKPLIEALQAVGDGVEASIAVDVNGESFVGKFTKHDHAGHKH